ncbi:unnamed protein product, partial [Heterotrigona itama]
QRLIIPGNGHSNREDFSSRRTCPASSSQASASRSNTLNAVGIAQSVKHQTLNLRVQGSSPCSGEKEEDIVSFSGEAIVEVSVVNYHIIIMVRIESSIVTSKRYGLNFQSSSTSKPSSSKHA